MDMRVNVSNSCGRDVKAAGLTDVSVAHLTSFVFIAD